MTMNEVRLIDANALKKDVENVSTHWLNSWDTMGILIKIDDAPTIDAVPVIHAKWVKRGNKHQCTNCKVLIDIDGAPEENLLYYCPHCGAKMDLEDGDSHE